MLAAAVMEAEELRVTVDCDPLGVVHALLSASLCTSLCNSFAGAGEGFIHGDGRDSSSGVTTVIDDGLVRAITAT